MPNWTVVFSTVSRHEAEIVKGLLENHDIQAVVMDVGPSAYPPLGETQVYVERDHVVRALYLVRKHREA